MWETQRKDSDIAEIIKLKESNAVLTSATRRGARRAVKKLMHEWIKLSMEGGLIFRKTEQICKLILPNQHKVVYKVYIYIYSIYPISQVRSNDLLIQLLHFDWI